MKRYKLTKSPNPETHAFGEVIFIKDENGNELNVGFGDQCDAFDYIKLQVENDKEYADYLNNPSKHIMDMYNSLDEFDKKMIEQSLIQKYRNECMYEYLGYKILITEYITKDIQRRTHKKKCINKKWLKRYGMKIVPDNTKILLVNNTLMMTENVMKN